MPALVQVLIYDELDSIVKISKHAWSTYILCCLREVKKMNTQDINEMLASNIVVLWVKLVSILPLDQRPTYINQD